MKYEGKVNNPSYYEIKIYPIKLDKNNKYFSFGLNIYNESKMNDL